MSVVLVCTEFHKNIGLCANVFEIESIENGKRTEVILLKAWP
jgi:hypothetical protein